MDDVSAGITDLVLGAVLAGCAVRLHRAAEVHRWWRPMFWTAAGGALVGAAHHLLLRGSRRAADLSWSAVGVLVAVAISLFFAASAAELLDRRLARLSGRVLALGVLAYVLAVASGEAGGTTSLVVCESVTMAAIVGLWVSALYGRRPGAGLVLLGIALCAVSTAGYAIPAGALRAGTGLDAQALQHVAQIPGLLLICHAVASGAVLGRQPAPARPDG